MNKHNSLLERAAWLYYVETLGLSDRQYQVSLAGRRDKLRGRKLARLLDAEIGLAGKNVLDVGSGWGEVACLCQEHGATTFGIEPDRSSIEVAAALTRGATLESLFICGNGEALPFPSEAFDLVICNHVIEHVSSPEATIRELVRVTCVGGHILLAFPNYSLPFEGHYRLPWIPFMPKGIGVWYLRLLGRDPRYFEHHINYVTYGNILQSLNRHDLEVRCLTEERLRRGRLQHKSFLAPAIRIQLALKLFKSVTFLARKIAPSKAR